MIGVFAGVLALGRWVAGASLASTVVLVVLGVLAGVAVRPGSWWTTGMGDGARAGRRGPTRGQHPCMVACAREPAVRWSGLVAVPVHIPLPRRPTLHRPGNGIADADLGP